MVVNLEIEGATLSDINGVVRAALANNVAKSIGTERAVALCKFINERPHMFSLPCDCPMCNPQK